jgi:hypothetical protein
VDIKVEGLRQLSTTGDETRAIDQEDSATGTTSDINDVKASTTSGRLEIGWLSQLMTE